MPEFPNTLRKLKRRRSLTAKQIAAACDVSTQTVYGWLNGKMPRIKHLNSLSAYLNVSKDYLLHGENPEDVSRVLAELNTILPHLSQSQLYAILIVAREMNALKS